MSGDIPQMLPTHTHAYTSYNLGGQGLSGTWTPDATVAATNVARALGGSFSNTQYQQLFAPQEQKAQPKKEKKVAKDSRRLVEVIIVDPDPNVPLEQAVLYQGERKLTELDDQELFFELDIKQLLADYNAKRTKIVNKSVKERTEYLEPARVRDLKMVVVNVATF